MFLPRLLRGCLTSQDVVGTNGWPHNEGIGLRDLGSRPKDAPTAAPSTCYTDSAHHVLLRLKAELLELCRHGLLAVAAAECSPAVLAAAATLPPPCQLVL